MSNIGGDEPVIITCALTGGIHGKEANLLVSPSVEGYEVSGSFCTMEPCGSS